MSSGYLLDTSTILRALGQPERLSVAATKALRSSKVVLSVSSYWEVTIKVKKGYLEIDDSTHWWQTAVDTFAANVLSIRADHIAKVTGLPDLHRDPFDRVLIAQAIHEELTVVTSDRLIARYPVKCLW